MKIYFIFIIILNVIKMNITLYEKIDRIKLNEVLNCDNIPFDEEDEPGWKEKFKTSLNYYSKKQQFKEGIKVIYEQKNKYGRLYSKNALQSFQREVRKYISGEFYQDIDIKNCHPVLIEQLLKKHQIVAGNILEEYNINRNEAMQKYNLNSKLDFIKIINNDVLKNEKFKETHDLIYNNLVPKLIKENKTLFNRIKKNRIKEKKEYNFNGSFFSTYLQNIENDILMVIYNYLCKEGFIIGVLCFDGAMVEKNNNLNEKILKQIQTVVLKETGYNIKLTFKSTETKWKPNLVEDIQIEDTRAKSPFEEFSIEKWIDLSSVFITNEDGSCTKCPIKIKNFVDYSNKFICLFETPHAYGWRDRTNEEFQMRKNDALLDRTGKYINYWKHSDLKLKYQKMVFIVNEKDPILFLNVYNRYIRPPMKFFDGEFKDKCPLFYDFLFRVICNSDNALYNWLINYMSKVFQVGLSGQGLVLMGEKGTGKSSFCEILAHIIDTKYHQTLNDIHQMDSQFNALSQTTILTVIEEVVNNAGDYHKINSKLKSLITEKHILIQKKGIDQFMDISNNNIIINSNGINPIHITNDNRRYCIIKVLNHEQKNSEYFNKLKIEVNEYIEYIRYYLYNFNFISDLNSIRPTTDAELNVLALNISPADEFIKSLAFSNEERHYTREFQNIYNDFRIFCSTNGYKSFSKRYFTEELKKYGYDKKRMGKENITFITGECLNEYINDLDDLDMAT